MENGVWDGLVRVLETLLEKPEKDAGAGWVVSERRQILGGG